MRSGILLTAAVLTATATAWGNARDELQEPFRVEADGEPITVDMGHAHPLYADFDGDGVNDLLVGQFGQGKLRIYRNVGTNEEPSFEGFAWFEAGGQTGSVPAG